METGAGDLTAGHQLRKLPTSPMKWDEKKFVFPSNYTVCSGPPGCQLRKIPNATQWLRSFTSSRAPGDPRITISHLFASV